MGLPVQGGEGSGASCLSVSSGKFQLLPWSLCPALGALAWGLGLWVWAMYLQGAGQRCDRSCKETVDTAPSDLINI